MANQKKVEVELIAPVKIAGELKEKGAKVTVTEAQAANYAKHGFIAKENVNV